jgi:hypothetical protein
MSGGYFDYQQHRIRDIYESIEEYILKNKYEYSEETIKELKKAVNVLKVGYIYAHRIDWLLSGDDGEEAFHKRLKEELKK